MKLSEVLCGRNVEGKIYICDVQEWVGDISYSKAEELRDKLMEIQSEDN